MTQKFKHEETDTMLARLRGSKIRGLTLVAIAVLLLGGAAMEANAQAFVRVIDFDNPIFSDLSIKAIGGSAWVDYDLDGRIDLFVADSGRNFLYHNDGGGNFTKITNSPIVQDSTWMFGTAWADFDNDGDPDCITAGQLGSALYRNDGGTFVELPDSHLGLTDSRGYSPTWADYDNDGYLDLVITFPAATPATPMPQPHRSNLLLHNDGPPNFTFTPVDTTSITATQAPFTVANWSDFDQDGDMDLFMGAGPLVISPGPDYIYRNMLTETGTVSFEQISDPPLFQQNSDGQMWSLIDYDNDGDLDAYQTNLAASLTSQIPNRLFRNDNGTYTQITDGEIVNDLIASIGNTWADFDNDGDLDCYVAVGAGQPDAYYVNNGDGTFTPIDTGAIIGGSTFSLCSTAGDYDDDGDLDLFINEFNPFGRRLLRNDLANGYNWLKIRLEGVFSNRSAVGAIVRVKANIFGQDVWQMREVSTQNSFNGHNSLIQHFGLGDATAVDSVIIEWPSGGLQDTVAVSVNQLIVIEEGCMDPDGDAVCSFADNCPDDTNGDQVDSDGDGLGDACDTCPDDPANDGDSDGFCATEDNCPDITNPDQADNDGDGVGNACCCVGVSGNTDCDPADNVDVGDLTALISHLFAGGGPLCCPGEGNVDGDAGGSVDIGDITALISFLFTSGAAPAECGA